MRGLLQFAFALGTAGALALAPPALAQSSCSSDGQPRPRALLERFISADCAQCWAQAGPAESARTVALDWIVPGSAGEDAPLSAAATRDALLRLQSLGLDAPAQALERRRPAASGRLRVAHGLPFNGYIGTSIEWRGSAPAPRRAWLALVESVPAGTEGSPVARELVRNLLPLEWPRATGGQRTVRHFEARPMYIAEGARPERLHVVGWVEDEKGRLLALSQSVCVAPPKGE